MNARWKKNKQPVLLTRDQFREAVFQRDHHKCVICGEPGVDAHHILDRKLFADGGYYLDNGATLCSRHHWDAEKCILTVEQIRLAAGIMTIILPPYLLPETIYDKWGKPSQGHT
ncbi:HNH endonuclease [Paraflavisolibacter sp. H34]|uniref:HNH endonuclease n=1 Tax=Huijunlia imazamoxiresistens TaxID=3127457 RepID=UPI003017CEBB